MEIKPFVAERSQKKRRTYCGPYALALLSGLDYDGAYDKLLKRLNFWLARNHPRMSKYHSIQGMGLGMVEETARTLKLTIAFEAAKMQGGNKFTLLRYFDHLKPRTYYLVNITDHYLVVNTHDWTVCDNQSKGWVPIATYKFKLSRVCYLAEVKPKWKAA